MRLILSSIISATLCMGVASAAPLTAALEVVSGPVYIDQGNGLVEADRFTLVNKDDKILLKAGATALLVNDAQGCVVSLRDAGMYHVPDMSTCHAGQASVIPSNITISPANGVYEPGEAIVAGQAGGAAAGQTGVLVGLSFATVVAAAATYSTVYDDASSSSP